MNNLISYGQTSVSILQKPVTYITEEEKDKLKSAIDRWAKTAKEEHSHKSTTYIAERDKLLVEWLFNTGMRISDVVGNPYVLKSERKDKSVKITNPYSGIKFRDIDMQKEIVTFIVHKRSRNKPFILSISLDKSILFEVQRFKEMFLFKNDDEIFQITRQTFDENLEKYCKIAGLPKYSAHKFRHGCAMKDLKDGKPDFLTSYRLGHSSTQVTNEIYRRMSVDIEREMRKTDWKNKI